MTAGADAGTGLPEPALGLLRQRNLGVLATIRRDGRPQLSNVVYLCQETLVRVSVTAGRAKVANARRDPRVSLHVTTDEFRPYLVAEGSARLSPVAQSPDDGTVDELVEVYRGIRGEHPDWEEFRQAMVAQRRLVLSFLVTSLYGTAG